MTSHATLTYKRSLHSTSLCCSFHATHTQTAHTASLPKHAHKTLRTPLSHLGSLQHHHCYTMHTRRRLSHTRKTLLGSLSGSIHALFSMILTRSYPSTNYASTLDRMRAGALTTRPSSTARQVSHPTAESETDRSPSHHMYYTRRQARYPALVQQGVHQHMIQAALNKRAS